VVRARHRQRRPPVERNPTARRAIAGADDRSQRQRGDHPRIDPVADRQLDETCLVLADLRRQLELLLAGVELEQQSAGGAARRDEIADEKGGGRFEIGSFGERRQQRETTPLVGVQSAFSSLSLMFTKLYGGHGPEYLNASTSSYRRLVSFTRSSNACSCARSTRNAAFKIIRSPIGLFDRLATATGFNASCTSAT